VRETLINLIRPEVRGQEAYVADLSPCRIKLDANENPFLLRPALRKKWLAALREVPLNRYPEPGAPALLPRFAEAWGVDSAGLMIGNGSDELIQILCTSLQGTNVLVPTPTFVMYRISALNNGHRVTEVPLDGDFDLDLGATLEKIRSLSPALIFLSYPNNPTGNCFSREKIIALLESAPGFVVVDEAYGNFSGQSFLPLLGKYDNLVILKTLSKVGLAALRIGFLIGAPSLVRELNKVRLPYNLNALSQVGAGFYLEHEAAFLKQAREIVRMREKLFRALQAIPGIHPYRSEANFVFFSCLFDTDNVYEKLRRQGIIIKNFNRTALLKNCMRVTVGSEGENDAFLEALQRIIAE